MIRLYVTDVRPLQDACLFHQASLLASSVRRETLAHLPKKQQILFLGAELLLHRALYDLGYTDIQLNYTYGRYGKPSLRDYPNVHFSISHSGDYAIVSVSDTEIGCDIEKIRDTDLSAARRYFCPEEYADILRIPDKETEVFFRYWTLKESFTKILGRGLVQTMNSFQIDLTSGDVRIIQEITPETYFFHEPDIIPGYHCAVCTAQAGSMDLYMIDLTDTVKGL